MIGRKLFRANSIPRVSVLAIVDRGKGRRMARAGRPQVRDLLGKAYKVAADIVAKIV
jgi:hypothetical protein